MTLATVLYWLHLTICPDHKLTARCETKRYLCEEQLCLELIREKKPTSAIWSPA